MAGWEEVAAAKRDGITARIPAQWLIPDPPSRQAQRDVTGQYVRQFLSDEETLITETDAIGIAAKTTTGEWSAVTVATAFCHRAALAHQLTNCLLEVFFEDAIRDAQELDNHLAANKTPVGPLHGVPVSLKDQFHVRGVETTMGYVGWSGTFQGVAGTGKERVFESELVRELRALGAVLYCKTSVPHTLMCGETTNNILGDCWNPNNRQLSAGGSSGGEGALIAMRGSPIGFGSDIGGSVRIPAAFNGLFGLRPSSGRMPYEGAANSVDGQNTILSVIGPLAPTIESLQFVFKAVLTQEPWLHDPLCLHMPWRYEEEKSMLDLTTSGAHLAFGVSYDNGVVHPHPPVARAMRMVCSTLESLGHQLLDWQPTPSHAHLADIANKVWGYDGGRDARDAFALSGERKLPQIFGRADGGVDPEKTASEIHAINVEKRDAQKAFMDYWNGTAATTSTGRPVDCIISPVAATAAVEPRKYIHYHYSMFVNTLDYTSIVIPVTRVDKRIDVLDQASFKPFGKEDEMVAATYDPTLYEGAPVSVQLIGRRLQEEKMLALAAYISKSLSATTQS